MRAKGTTDVRRVGAVPENGALRRALARLRPRRNSAIPAAPRGPIDAGREARASRNGVRVEARYPTRDEISRAIGGSPNEKIRELARFAPELERAYREIAEREKDLTLERFLDRISRGIEEFAMADRSTLHLAEGRTSILDEIGRKPGAEERVEYLASSFRWAKLRERTEALDRDPIKTRIDAVGALRLFLARYSTGSRAAILQEFDRTQAPDDFIAGYRHLVEGQGVIFTRFVDDTLARRQAPIPILIAAGRYAAQVKEAVQSGNAGELSLVFLNYADEETYRYLIVIDGREEILSLEASHAVPMGAREKIIADALIETGAPAVSVMVASYRAIDRQVSSEPVKLGVRATITEAMVKIAEKDADGAAAALTASLVENFQADLPIKDHIEAQLMVVAHASAYHLMAAFARINFRGSESRIVKAAAARIGRIAQILKLLEGLTQLILQLFLRTETDPYMVRFVKESSAKGKLSLHPKIVAYVFDHHARSVMVSAEGYDISLAATPAENNRFMAQVKRIYEDNRPQGDASPSYQANVLLIAGRMLAVEDMIWEGHLVEAQRELRRLMARARAADLRLSAARSYLGYIYAGIIERIFIDGDRELRDQALGGAAKARSLSNYAQVLEAFRTQIYTSVERDYKDAASPQAFPETILAGMVMRRVNGQAAKAARVISVLKADEAVWGKLLNHLADGRERELRKIQRAIEVLFEEAIKQASVGAVAGPLREVRVPTPKDIFQTRNLQNALREARGKILIEGAV